MAISDKLNYLIETKSKFKDRLNSLGAEIIESTTFRNYLNWLDEFYGNVSDKTDMAENGIVGETSQETSVLPSDFTQVDYIESHGTEYIDTGINADMNLDINISLASVNRITFGAIYNNNGSYIRYHTSINDGKYTFYILQGATVSTISTDTNVKHNFYIQASNRIVIVDNTSYALPANTDTDTNLSFWLFRRNSNDSSLQFFNSSKLYSCKMYYNNALVRNFIPCYRNSDNKVGLYDLVNDVFYTNQGTGAFTYGSVVSLPNPDYPMPIVNRSGELSYRISGKNSFDKDNANILNAYFAQEKIIASSSTGRTLYISCKPNTTYTISKIQGSRFRVLTTETTPTLNTNGIDYQANDSATSLTITTSSNSNYLCVYFYSANDTLTEQQLLDSIQIEEGAQATSYEPYISESFPLSLGDIELCNISDYKDLIYSQNGEFYLEKKNGKVVFDGSENWEKHTTTAADIYMIFIPNSIGYEYGSGKIAPAICNSFIARALGSFPDNTYGVFGITPSLQTRFFVGATGSHYADINAWKQYLANNNMIVYFALATPTTTEITQENYPTLYSQLLAIQEFLTKYKINKEFLLDYSSPEIEY